MRDAKCTARRGGVPEAGGARGFTLIETSIALLIMLVAALSVASLFIYAINYNSGANDRALAQAIGQERMEALRKTPIDQLASSEVTVTRGGRTFNVVTSVCSDGSTPCGGPAMRRIRVDVRPQSAGATWVRSTVSFVTLRGDLSVGPYFP